MNRQDEEVFLLNASLGTDLLTSLAATGRSRKPSGCVLLVIAVLVILSALWIAW
jgi:hypothetical protein